MDNVDSDNIKNKISNYEKAKGNINQAIVNLQSIRNALNNKNDFQSDRINTILKELDNCISSLKSKKESISSSIYSLKGLLKE